jgi:hypothetical protein
MNIYITRRRTILIVSQKETSALRMSGGTELFTDTNNILSFVLKFVKEEINAFSI